LLQKQDEFRAELRKALNKQNNNCRTLQKILLKKNQEIAALKKQLDLGESLAILRSENEMLHKELVENRSRHEQIVKAMQESSESSINQLLQEVTELKSALNNMENVAEENTEAARQVVTSQE
jgi:hypothetical protein